MAMVDNDATAREGTSTLIRSGEFICSVGMLTVLLWSPALLALDPSLEINQYGHTAWLVRDGFPKGNIRSIAQSPDGYLWLGTEFGLVRFDGTKNVTWTPPAGQRLPSTNIRSLVAARDGTLWIGTLEGLASWKDGKLTQYPELAKQNVYTLLEDRDGTIWAGTFAVPTARLCEIRGGAVTCHGQDGSVGQWVESLYEDSRGRVWAGTMTGLWRWKPGPPARSSLPHSIDTAQAVVEDEHGLIAIGEAMWQLVDGTARKYPLAGVRGPLTPLHMLRDRAGGLWIGTLQRGLVHVYRGRTDLFAQRDGLSGDDVLSLFEDREGNVWVATPDGLDRFRGVVASSISVKQGLSSPSTMTALVAHDGAVWTSTLDGLNRWNKGDITIFRAHASQSVPRLPDYGGVARSVREVTDAGLADNEPGSLFEDDDGGIWVSSIKAISRFQNGRFTRVSAVPGGWVNVMTGDRKGGIWIAYQDQGLYHLVRDKVVEQIPWAKLGHTVASSMAADRARGGLWLGFFDGGLVYLDGGQVLASYGEKDGLGAGRVMDVRLDGDDTLWAASEGGLSRVKDGRVITLNSRNGLPCDGVHWATEDSAHFFWLYTTCGLVRIATSELQALTSQPERKIQRTVFDASDGVGLKALLTGYTPRVSTSADGKIWFAHFDRVSVIDPLHLTFNDLLPPVHIEQITGDGKIYDPHRRGRLPALVRNVSIDYTALSLVAPEKVHFRYKLEPQDPDWREVINDREVQYSNLPPGNYRFHVTASNNSGVWNDKGDVVDFSIAPAYYQTNWFRALCVAAVLTLLWAAYQLRTQQLHREFKQMRDVIETVPAMAWTALPDGSNAFVNRRWAEFTGLSTQDTAGSGWTAAVHPQDIQPYAEKWRASLATGEPFEFEARFRCVSNGEYRWLLARSVPLKDEHGRVVRWYGILTDIDDRKRAEETVRESETRFRTFADHVGDAILVQDERGTIVDVNRQGCEALGYTREEVVGRFPFDSFCPNTDRAGLEMEEVARRTAGGERVSDRYWHQRKDGTVFLVEVDTSLFWYRGRRFLLKAVRDISESLRAEEERQKLRQLESDLAHINRVSMMGELSVSIAHEVNQPLTGIVSNGSACLRWLAGDSPNLDEARETVRRIVRDGKRAGEVIARIRALTRRAATATEKLDLNETIREVLALVGDEAKRRSVIIRTHFADDLAPVSCDRVQLQQVVLNLIMNGVEAMSSVDDRARELAITTRNVDADQVQVTVEDSGVGLDQSTMARIFDPFYTTKPGGMGMGLSISRTILQAHGGRLWGTPKDGPGTIFKFALPKCQEESSMVGP